MENFTTHLAPQSPPLWQCYNDMLTEAGKFHTFIFPHSKYTWEVHGAGKRSTWMNGCHLETQEIKRGELITATVLEQLMDVTVISHDRKCVT